MIFVGKFINFNLKISDPRFLLPKSLKTLKSTVSGFDSSRFGELPDEKSLNEE